VIKGKIRKTWIPDDYINGPWRTNKYHYKGFQTSSTNKKLYKNNIGVYINNDVNMNFSKISKKFKLNRTVVALNKMDPGQILPFHIDLYKTYIKRNDVKNQKDIVRIILFLEDSVPGHQLWIGDSICTGNAGSYFGWSYGEKHMAANLSDQARYTLQITGLRG